MLAILISSIETSAKATTPLRDAKGITKLEKTTFFTFILKAILHKGNIEKE